MFGAGCRQQAKPRGFAVRLRGGEPLVLELSGHVALRHPQSNENGRYERGEALTENKALSAYFQGRTNREPLLLTPVTKPRGRTLDSFAETELRLPIELPAGLIHIQVDVVDFARPSGSVTALD